MLENLTAKATATCDGLGFWLVKTVAEQRTLEALFPAFCEELRRRELPIWRGQVGLEVLHPEQVGWMMIWKDENLTIRDAQRAGVMSSADYLNSPTRIVDETEQTFRRRLDEPSPDMPLLEDLRNQGATDYVMIPLPFLDKQRRSAVVSFATMQADGFTEDQVAALELAAYLFSPYAERHVLRRITIDLLNTYVGPRSGRRITDGQIELGQLEQIEAAIWLADMRGFTSFSEQAPIADVIAALNIWLKPMVAKIEEHGGEVLKFIGDAVLAIFPAGDDKSAQAACLQALGAAKDFCWMMDVMNTERRAEGLHVLEFGLTLHIGEVAYGNIGAPTRLDFTVIGPAVNRAARMQELTKQLGQRLLISEAFAEAAGCALQDVGSHNLRDIDGAQRVFIPLKSEPAENEPAKN
ncbi:MAG: adenylate/guanylate cyclase domain-containing protein [Dongiaceae bacterium]